jgi:curved DNA-binding protein CbpA
MYRDSHYGVLRLPLNATTAQIQAKAWQLEQVHIDLAMSGDEQAVLRLREIREARAVLCNPAKRGTYDRAYVAAITAHLRYVPPHPDEYGTPVPAPREPLAREGLPRAREARQPGIRETWLVFGPGAHAS